MDQGPLNVCVVILQFNVGKPAPERKAIVDYNEARDGGGAVALAEP